MSKISHTGRMLAAMSGAAMLLSVGGLAFAEDALDSGGVTIVLDVQDVDEGALTMTVAGTSTALTENGSDATTRVFTGSLPTVTVTDTRDAEDIPDGAFWYVVGTASDFVSGSDVIGAENLGWAPQLIDGGDSGLVAEGDVVDPDLDGGPGLVDQELLAMAADSQTVNPEGQWTATAELVLKTDADVAAGQYESTLTLSLFE